MCFKFPAFFGVEIQEIERTPYGPQVVKTTTYGYTGPKSDAHEKRQRRRRSHRDSYHSSSTSTSYTAMLPPPPSPQLLPPPPRYEADYVEVVDAVPPSPPFRRQTVAVRPQSGRFDAPIEYSARTHRASLPQGVTVDRRNSVAAAARPASGVRYLSPRENRRSASDTDSSLSTSDASETSEMGAARRRRW